MVRREIAHRIRVSGITREHVRLTAAATEVLGLLRTAAARLLHPLVAAEGAEGALLVLQPAFERVGGKVSLIDARAKVIYHAASVIVCNYLTSLMETGLRCYEQSGIDRETATAMTEPIVRETLENVLQLGPARALTGPIARGDASVVARHLEALDAWDERVASVYRALGTLAVELARSRGDTDMSALERIAALLSR